MSHQQPQSFYLKKFYLTYIDCLNNLGTMIYPKKRQDLASELRKVNDALLYENTDIILYWNDKMHSAPKIDITNDDYFKNINPFQDLKIDFIWKNIIVGKVNKDSFVKFINILTVISKIYRDKHDECIVNSVANEMCEERKKTTTDLIDYDDIDGGGDGDDVANDGDDVLLESVQMLRETLKGKKGGSTSIEMIDTIYENMQNPKDSATIQKELDMNPLYQTIRGNPNLEGELKKMTSSLLPNMENDDQYNSFMHIATQLGGKMINLMENGGKDDNNISTHDLLETFMSVLPKF